MINGGVEGDRTGVSDMIREMFLYYYGEHSQDVVAALGEARRRNFDASRQGVDTV